MRKLQPLRSIVRRSPWSGVGATFPEGATAEEALQVGKLDWKVELRPVFDEKGKKLDAKWQRTVRMDNDETLGLMSSRYEVLQNREMIDFCAGFSNLSEAKIASVGYWRGGRVVWAMMKLAENAIHDDEHKLYLLVSNNHDARRSLRVVTTDFTLSCENSLTAAFRNASNVFNVRHTRNLNDRVAEIRRVLGNTNTWAEKYYGTLRLLADREAPPAMVNKFVAHAFPLKEETTAARTQAILEKREYFLQLLETQPLANGRARGGTAYGLLCAATDYADHVMATQKQADARMESALLGSAATFKENAYDFILEEAAHGEYVPLVSQTFELN